jgi:type IV secretion system protein VirD4
VVPNCIHWGGSLLCFSVKDDVAREAAAARQARGDAVFLFHIGSEVGESHRWNPFSFVRLGTPLAFSDIQKIMFSVVPPTKSPNPFWDNAARRMGTAIAAILSETPGVKLNLAAVRRAIGRPDWKEYLTGLVNEARRAGRPYPAAAVDTLLGWTDHKDEEGAASVRETLTTALALWEIPEVAAITEESDFDMAAIRDRQMSIFVVAQPDEIRRYRLIYQLFFEQFTSLNMRGEFPISRTPSARLARFWAWYCGRPLPAAPANRIKYRALVMLDEFWALGQVSVLADAVAYTRSYGFRLAYVVQSKMQIISAFGKEGAGNLFLNAGAEILFGGTDPEVAKEVSERMGHNTEIETSKSAPRYFAWFKPSKQTENEAARSRALALPQEIHRMPKDEMVVLRPGVMPLRCKRVFWFLEPLFATSGMASPVWPKLAMTVDRDQGTAKAAGAAAGTQKAATARPKPQGKVRRTKAAQDA